MLLIETALIIIALVIAFLYPSLGQKQFEKVESAFSCMAHRRSLAVLVVGVSALALRAAVLPIEPIPEPIVHDEFGYLLAADTFVHGRLANATPPMWEHFETFHVMFHPSYASIYPPAQGLILALGKMVFGNPFWGVWLSVGLMCAGITWMLQGWLSPEWAFLGGILAILRYGVFSYWSNSYWGGTVAAIGGTLVLGALPRIKTSQRPRDALLMGLGLAVLANSRPYEGFVFSLPIAILLLIWITGKNRPPYLTSLQQVVLPLALVLFLTAAGMGYYFWRVTGSPFRMPYQIERQTYAIAPYMIWQHVRPEPAYHHAAMRKMFVEEEMLGRKDSGSLTGLLLRTYLAWSFFLGPALALPILMLVFDLPRGLSIRDLSCSTGILLLLLVTSALGSLLVNFYSPHYSAPSTGLIVAMVLMSVQQLRRWGSAGLFLARAIPAVCVLSFVARASAAPLGVPLREFYEYAWYQKGPPTFGRLAIQQELEKIPGNQLVILHYKPDHRPFEEWVYNDADIDHAKIIWAREMDPVSNQKLIKYFNNRRCWIVEADEDPPRLSLYTASSRQPSVSDAGCFVKNK